MATIAQARREALDKWWAREWPVVVLGIDPGREAGASLVVSRPGSIRLLWTREVDTYTRAVEILVNDAMRTAREENLPMVMAVEDWGVGGNRGLAQWIGLGEQRGAWIRALHVEWSDLLCERMPGIVKIPQTRWRSRLCGAHGQRVGTKFERYDSAQWKREAYHTARELFLDSNIDASANAAEAACIGYFAARADMTGKYLGKRWLAKHGLSFEALESQIRPKRGKVKNERDAKT